MTPAKKTPPAVPSEAPAPGEVRIQKRVSAPPGLRDKICATCGKAFQVTTEEKFFDCPDCHRKRQAQRRPRTRSTSQVLIQIACTACGKREYLDYNPPDPDTALCRSCYGKVVKEQKASTPHPSPRKR